MRKVFLTILASAMVAPLAPVAAQQASPTREVRSAPATQQSMQDHVEFDRQAAQLHENMNRMQDHMNQIRQAQDPQQRQRLLQEHWMAMQNTMNQMHAMEGVGAQSGMGGTGSGMGPGMGPGMLGWQNMRGQYEDLTPAQLGQRQYMTEERLRLQQAMMDQMMQQMMQNHYWQAQAHGGQQSGQQPGQQSGQVPSPWQRVQ